MRKHNLLAIIGAGLAAGVAAASSAGGKPPAAEHGLIAVNSPRRVRATVKRKTAKTPLRYVWYYRTEVRNAALLPLRIVSLEPQRWEHGKWLSARNVTGHPLTSREFSAWYTEGAPVRDGWIAPGAVAVCDPNYTWYLDPAGRKMRWVFTAEDANGKKYHAEAPLELLPAR